MKAISEEIAAIQKKSASQWLDDILKGKGNRVIGALMFHADSSLIRHLALRAISLLNEEGCNGKYLTFLMQLSLSLESAQSYYRVRKILDRGEIAAIISLIEEALDAFSDEAASEQLLSSLASYHAARFRVEDREEKPDEDLVRPLFGGSLKGYIDWMKQEIRESKLFAHTRQVITASKEMGEVLTTMWGNDFGAFLDVAMYKGAMFQTTNPPLIKAAWDLELDLFSTRLSNAYSSLNVKNFPMGSLSEEEALVALLPAVIVSRNMELLKDYYLYSGGRAGFVCYQVNPEYHGDAVKMKDEILFVHAVLSYLIGGEPNVSFKLPGTCAGLKAAEALTSQGISLTITLSFAMFQAKAFAKVLAASNAVSSFIVVMNGRLAFPVRDQLIEMKGDESEAYIEAAKNAGVEVTRKVYRQLYSLEAKGSLALDPARVGIMNASLRIYGAQIPDITDIWGTPAITIFPNARYALDSCERKFDSDAVKTPENSDEISYLRESEIFRQAYYVDSDEIGRPENPLVLSEKTDSEVEHWGPIHETLTQFLTSHEQIRRAALAILNKGENT